MSKHLVLEQFFTGGLSYPALQARFEALTPAEIKHWLHIYAQALADGRTSLPYQHVNGFTKFTVAVGEDGAKLTVHFWPGIDPAASVEGASSEPASWLQQTGLLPSVDFSGYHVSRPHDHRTSLTSRLLFGRQAFVHLVKTNLNDPYATVFECVTYTPHDGGAEMQPAGRAALRVTDITQRYPLQGVYAISHSVTHMAAARLGEPHATLVLRGSDKRPSATTYYPPGVVPDRIQYGPPVARDTAVAQFQTVLDKLSDA